MKSLLVEVDIYFVNAQGTVRRKETSSPRWAWLRKNRGGFDRQPEDETKDIEIIADRVWRTRSQLELAIVEWVGWFNHARLHESLGDTRRPSTRLSTPDRAVGVRR
jgi:transposase InsO family protein